jgi:hypothetical protein
VVSACSLPFPIPGLGRGSAEKPAAAGDAAAAKPGAAAKPKAAAPTASAAVARTPDGKPDLQGFWNGATLTPLERPRDAKTAMTAEQATAIAERAARGRESSNQPSDPNRVAPPVGGDGSRGAAGGVGGYNGFWVDPGDRVTVINGEARTSIVIDPPDGRVPPVTPAAQARVAARRALASAPTSDAPENAGAQRRGAYDDVELRPLGERCLMSFGSSAGPPALPVLYNNIKQIVQTPDHVVILNEMVHDARIVRMGSEHLPPSVRKWLGDSIGRWDGDSLVVETTNFTPKTRFRGSTEDLKVTERFTRLDDKTLLYRFTVEDPATWSAPWSGEYTWAWSDQPVYEYACHEANYSLEGILKGARIQEAAAAKQAEQAKKAKPGPKAKQSK